MANIPTRKRGYHNFREKLVWMQLHHQGPRRGASTEKPAKIRATTPAEGQPGLGLEGASFGPISLPTVLRELMRKATQQAHEMQRKRRIAKTPTLDLPRIALPCPPLLVVNWPRRESNPHGGCPPLDFKSRASAIPPLGPGGAPASG